MVWLVLAGVDVLCPQRLRRRQGPGIRGNDDAPCAGNGGIEVGEVNGIDEWWHPRNPYPKVQRQFLSGFECIRGVTIVVSGPATDVRRWSVGNVAVVGSSKQEIGEIITGVLAIKV